MAKNIAEFERQHSAYDFSGMFKPELDFKADLVVVAIGENVPELSTDDSKAVFEKAFGDLLAEIAKHGKPIILVRGCFWSNPTKDDAMRRATEVAGAQWVEVGELGKDEQNFDRSERNYQHAGVSGHPGDKGMDAIAEAMWK